MKKHQKRNIKKGNFWVKFEQSAAAKAGVGNAAAFNQATAFDENETKIKKKHEKKKHHKKDRKKDHHKKDRKKDHKKVWFFIKDHDKKHHKKFCW